MNDNQILESIIHSRLSEFARYKINTIIGIYGSFLESNEQELISLRNYLVKNGYHAVISKDIHNDIIESESEPYKRARTASKKLIDISHIHIFVLKGKVGDSTHVMQSASMELERLNTLIEYGLKNPCPVIIYCEKGFIEISGSLCQGLLLERQDDWEIEEFEKIEDIFVHARQYCFRKIREMFHSK
jgi:hypothetical protein